MITLPVIVGPTAIGKTAVAVLVAEELNGEIVSADSRQLYGGMAIGSGAPSPDELRRVRHHFIGELEPTVRLSAGEYARMARERVEEVIARGKLPIIVGGSGLYVRALIDGLAPIEPHDRNVRDQVEREIEERGIEIMLDELTRVDPDYAQMVDPRNRKRLVRALEVFRMTGKPLSQWHRESPSDEWRNPLIFGLTRERPELHAIIEKRVRAMVDGGWIDELECLIDEYNGIDRLPVVVREALGYRDLLTVRTGETDLATAVERIVISTRQYAKRQMTWFRADSRIQWLPAADSDAAGDWARTIIDKLGKKEIMSPKIEGITA